MDDHQLADTAAPPATATATPAVPAQPGAASAGVPAAAERAILAGANAVNAADAEAAPAPFLPFALPDIGEEEIAAVADCLRSGWVTTGPATRRFEAAFGAYLGADVQTISVNSATAGLHLALEALGIGPGDEVIVPTLTFTATAEVVRYLGAQPVLVDVDAQTLNMAPAAVAAAITPRTRALIPVHYAGMACAMDELLALARRHGLRVVEDAAHAFPTRYKGRLVGTLDSDITVFSFYANKTMTTGEGGMVVLRDPDLARRVRMMRLHGISQDAFDRYVSKTPAWFYEVVAAGFKYNLTDIASAMGLEQLRKIDRFLARRQYLAARYDAALAQLPLVLPPRPEHGEAQSQVRQDGSCGEGNTPVRVTQDGSTHDGSTHAWHLYVVRLRAEAPLERDALILRLSQMGIGTSVHFIPLHRQPYWRDNCAASPDAFPVAEAAYSAMLTLPLYTRMRDADQDRVITALQALLS